MSEIKKREPDGSTFILPVFGGGYADIPAPDPIKDLVITDPPANDASCYTKNNGDSCDAGSGADSGYCEAGSCLPNSAATP